MTTTRVTIRSRAAQLFAERNPARAAGEVSNASFRKGILIDLAEEFSTSTNSAACAYNAVFQDWKRSNPGAVEGLGRPPEKNNGGPRGKVKPTFYVVHGADGVELFRSENLDIVKTIVQSGQWLEKPTEMTWAEVK